MTRIFNSRKPDSGTKEALAIGCTCPVIDNHYGKGHHGIAGEFVYNLSCPIHSMPLDELRGMMGITTPKTFDDVGY